jgi:hypothetical protein
LKISELPTFQSEIASIEEILRVKILIIARSEATKQSLDFIETDCFAARHARGFGSQEQPFVRVTARSIATKQSPSTEQADCFAEFTPL